jgi:hypothetical protein
MSRPRWCKICWIVEVDGPVKSIGPRCHCRVTGVGVEALVDELLG